MLYQGAIVEVGNVDRVIQDPQHPYTQLLVGSIPLPDPKLRVRRVKLRLPGDELGSTPARGCRFARRCPHVMPKCHDAAPPLFRTSDDRAAACYLYEGAPSVT